MVLTLRNRGGNSIIVKTFMIIDTLKIQCRNAFHCLYFNIPRAMYFIMQVFVFLIVTLHCIAILLMKGILCEHCIMCKLKIKFSM